MAGLKIGRSHKARKALFARGIRRGYLSLDEIDEAVPAGTLTDAERWLLFYSLRAARVEIRDASGRRVQLDPSRGEDGASELERLEMEQIEDDSLDELEADSM